MNKFTNPLVWLCRVRHRCGYGVHSPFAFKFLTDVVYETTPYYIYGELDSQLELLHRFRVRRVLHLLMRCVNYAQPRQIVAPNAPQMVLDYLAAGCRKAALQKEFPQGEVDFCYLDRPDSNLLDHVSPRTVLVMDNLRQHREWFMGQPSVVSMDLYDVGIAFFDPKYKKQHYIINF